jgi:hypothetical protein
VIICRFSGFEVGIFLKNGIKNSFQGLNLAIKHKQIGYMSVSFQEFINYFIALIY